jgi:ApbE superfamily uncharacterized protein (UPF0280 family)
MYEERTYRRTFAPDDLYCFEVVYKETDLFCCTSVDVRPLIEEKALLYRSQLESYIRMRPEFLESLVPISPDPLAPSIVREMIEASGRADVGPMACVAGAIAEFVGRDINPFADEYIIENGGDICLKTGCTRTVVVYAGDSPYSGRIGLRIRARELPYGICTSSATVGPSLSLGKTDAVCVISGSALFSDALATTLGNLVQEEGDIGPALEEAQKHAGVTGVLIILGDKLGAWGDVDLTKV